MGWLETLILWTDRSLDRQGRRICRTHIIGMDGQIDVYFLHGHLIKAGLPK